MLGRKKLIPYLFISPFFITFLAFQVGPIFYGFWMSFQEIMAVTMPTKFVGWTNYFNLLTNERFYNSLKVSARYTLGHGALHLIVALALALILNLKLKGRNFYRMIFFLPVVTSLAVSALIWRLILDDKVGLLNVALRAIGLAAEYRWLDSPGLALTSIIMIGSWRWFGFQMVIMLAGLQNIPNELYDAAKVDGAGPLQLIWHITLPLLFPVLFFCIAITIIGSLMLFEEPFILTNGGPKDSTMSLAMYLYISGFRFFKLGYASALGYVMTLLIMGVAYLQVRLLGGRAGLSS
jgi:lactose/L-arabinose transport system permease protein